QLELLPAPAVLRLDLVVIALDIPAAPTVGDQLLVKLSVYGVEPGVHGEAALGVTALVLLAGDDRAGVGRESEVVVEEGARRPRADRQPGTGGDTELRGGGDPGLLRQRPHHYREGLSEAVLTELRGC